MDRFRIKYSVLILAGMMLAVLSCTPEACLDETESYLKVSFYRHSTLRVQPPDSLTVRGLGMDTSFVYNKSRNIPVAKLPLNINTGVTVFILTINDLTDTLYLTHSSFPHLISKECGYTYFHTLDPPGHTINTIDSLVFKTSTVTTADEENIRIYY